MSDPTAIDSREFRNALGCFATGIVVVTTIDSEGVAVGITANSFSSLSLDPPLVLWSIDKNSTVFEPFHRCKNFVVSVLDASAAEVSTRFAMKSNHKVDGVPTIPTKLGPPAFPEALAVFECDVHARHEGGDHIILVGKVVGFNHVADPDRRGPPPLLYYRGRYRGLAAFEG